MSEQKHMAGMADALEGMLAYVEGYAASSDSDDPVHVELPRARQAVAAAKDLLEALKAIAANTATSSAVSKIARAAIARAEGRS